MFFYLNFKYIFGCRSTRSDIFYILYFYIMCFVKKKIQYWVGRSTFFFLLSFFMRFGIVNNPMTMFLTHSSSEYVLYLLYDLFCDGPTSFCNNYLLQFSFSEFSVTSGLFLSKIKPCCNFWKCCSHFVIVVSVFLYIYTNWEISCVNKCQKLLFIGLSLCLIMPSNCSTFFKNSFYVVRNPFAIAFLYTSIWIICGVISFLLSQSLFVYYWFFFTQNHDFFEFFSI